MGRRGRGRRRQRMSMTMTRATTTRALPSLLATTSRTSSSRKRLTIMRRAKQHQRDEDVVDVEVVVDEGKRGLLKRINAVFDFLYMSFGALFHCAWFSMY